MYIDGLTLLPGSSAKGFTVESGPAFPSNAQDGQWWRLTAEADGYDIGEYWYDATNSKWVTGDITAVLTGSGLLGGGDNGEVTITLDQEFLDAYYDLRYKPISASMGEKGEKGDPGEPGLPGADGNDGAQGIPGPQGEKGEKGEKGDQGIPGNDGAPGAAGQDGAAGLKGDQGEPGADGLDGAQGAQGIPGPQGEQGLPGTTTGDVNTDFTTKNLTVAGDESVAGNLTIGGNLNVQGTVTTVNQEVITTGTTLITLNDGETGAGVSGGTSGLNIDRGTATDAQLVFNEADDTWRAGIAGSLEILASRPWATAAFTPLAHVGSTGAAHGVATTSVSGFMSAADKARLDTLVAGGSGLSQTTADARYMKTIGGAFTGAVTLASDASTAMGAVTKQQMDASSAAVVSSSLQKSGGTVTSLTVTNPIVGSVTGNAANVTGVVALTNGGTGANSAANARLNLGAAPLDSPTLTGTPRSTTPLTADNSTRIATTEFVKAQGYLTSATAPSGSWSGLTGKPTTVAGFGIADALSSASIVPQAQIPYGQNSTRAIIASPEFTFSTGPGAGPGGSYSQAILNLGTSNSVDTRINLATGNYPGLVQINANASSISTNVGSGQTYTFRVANNPLLVITTAAATFYNVVNAYQGINGPLTGNVTGNLTGNLLGTPLAPTPASTDSSTKVATTAFVKAQGYATSNGTAGTLGQIPTFNSSGQLQPSTNFKFTEQGGAGGGGSYSICTLNFGTVNGYDQIINVGTTANRSGLTINSTGGFNFNQGISTALTQFKNAAGTVVQAISNTGVAITGNLSVSGTFSATGLAASSLSGTVGVANGGTGVTTLSGLVYGNGTGNMTAATSAQVQAVLNTSQVTFTQPTSTTNLVASGTVYASAAGGFATTNFVNGRNVIWKFGDSTNYGLSYFQGTGGIRAGVDTFGFHFGQGTPTAANSYFRLNSDGTLEVLNGVTAASFTGAGTGLTGTAASLTVGAATSASTAAKLTTARTIAGVSFDGTANISLGVANITGAAPLASPAFTGTVTVPTATAGDNSTVAASTAFVTAAVATVTGSTNSATATKLATPRTISGVAFDGSANITIPVSGITGAAPTASPTFTGTVTVPTAASSDNSTAAASTAFVKTAIAAVASPYDLASSIIGKPAASAVVLRFIAVRAFTIPAALAGTQAKAATAATASTVLSLQKNGTQFGTMTWAAAGTTATLAAASATSFAIGDVLTIVAPASQDATFADAEYTIVANLG